MNENKKILAEIKTEISHVSGALIYFGTVRTHEKHVRVSESCAENFVLSWILTGSGEFLENGQRFEITPNCYCLRRPTKNYTMILSNEPSCRIFFDLPSELYPAFSLLIPELDNIAPVGNCVLQKRLFDEAMAILHDFPNYNLTNFYNMLPILIHYTNELTGIAASRTDSPLSRGRALLENTASEMALEDVAASCGMHYDSFRRQFRDQFGVTPGKFRTLCKISEAKRELLSGVPILYIAERLGYADVYTFTHRFKAETGISPSEYREEIGE